MARLESQIRETKEHEAATLARNVRQADLLQLEAKLDRDFATLKSRQKDERTQADNTAWDMKYIRDRQTMLIELFDKSLFFLCKHKQKTIGAMVGSLSFLSICFFSLVIQKCFKEGAQVHR